MERERIQCERKNTEAGKKSLAMRRDKHLQI